MDAVNLAKHTLGWIGTGRMGFPMAAKLAQSGGLYSRFAEEQAVASELDDLAKHEVDELMPPSTREEVHLPKKEEGCT